jgi:hypothetical protein
MAITHVFVLQSLSSNGCIYHNVVCDVNAPYSKQFSQKQLILRFTLSHIFNDAIHHKAKQVTYIRCIKSCLFKRTNINNFCVKFCLLIVAHKQVPMIIEEYFRDSFKIVYQNLGIFVDLPSLFHSQVPF